MKNKMKEEPRQKIGKVKIKNDRLVVEYDEVYQAANYSNHVTKTCDNIIHPDLRLSMSLLKPHLVAICELPESEKVCIDNPSEADLNDKLERYVVTGYSRGGRDESSGVTIIAQRILTSGKVLNITSPFTKFYDETGDGYEYGDNLLDVILRIEYEVDAYLNEEKFGVRQESFDFAEDIEYVEPEVAS